MKHFSLIRNTAALTGALMLSFSAAANSNNTSFDVMVQVSSTCSISAGNMTFSGITTGTTSNTDATSSITVNCSTGTPYTIALGNGNNYSGGRRMTNGTTNINYYLYSDTGRSTQWNSITTQAGTGSGSDQSYTVYGRIPSGQSVPYTGSYTDTVIATVTY